MRRTMLALAATVIALPVGAQSSQTRCRPTNYPSGGMICDTNPVDDRPPVVSLIEGFFNGLRAGRAARAANEREATVRARFEEDARDFARRATNALNEGRDSAKVSGIPADNYWEEASRPLRLLFEYDPLASSEQMRRLVMPIARGYSLWGDQFYNRAYAVYLDVVIDSLKIPAQDTSRALFRELVLRTVRPLFRLDLATSKEAMEQAVWAELRRIKAEGKPPV